MSVFHIFVSWRRCPKKCLCHYGNQRGCQTQWVKPRLNERPRVICDRLTGGPNKRKKDLSAMYWKCHKSNYSWLYQLEIKLLTTRTRYLKMSSTIIGSFKQPRQNDYATEPCGYMYGSDYRHSLDFLSCFLPYVSFTRRPCNQLYDFHYRQLTA